MGRMIMEIKAELFDVQYILNQLRTQEQNLLKELQAEVQKEREAAGKTS